MSAATELEWWQEYANVVTLTAYLAERGDSAGDVAYAVEKPWKYEDEFHEARAALEADS